MKKLFLILLLGFCVYAPIAVGGPIEQAYQKHQTNVQVQGSGTENIPAAGSNIATNPTSKPLHGGLLFSNREGTQINTDSFPLRFF